MLMSETRASAPAGPPMRLERRRRRRASDMPKPPCPWCGASTSAVYRSQRRALKGSTDYRRRRQCAECGRDWPTRESLDVDLFMRELEAQGLEIEALGLARARKADEPRAIVAACSARASNDS
jgi:hypothetical protein